MSIRNGGRSYRVVATIEARMRSSRLPGKVLMRVWDRPMLEYLVSRVRRAPSVDEIVLATTTNDADEPLLRFAEAMGISAYRGSEDDVMSRVIEAAEAARSDVVVELTGDNPLIDPQIIEHMIRMFAVHGGYVSNDDVLSYPTGMNTRVFPLEMLKRSGDMTSASLDREHVTLHIRQHPELFPHTHLVAPRRLYWPELSLTLDEEADFELLRRVIEHFAPDITFSCGDIIDLLRQKPEWVNINAHVRRKGAS